MIQEINYGDSIEIEKCGDDLEISVETYLSFGSTSCTFYIPIKDILKEIESKKEKKK